MSLPLGLHPVEENQRLLVAELQRLRSYLEGDAHRAPDSEVERAASGAPSAVVEATASRPPVLDGLRAAFGLSDFESDLLLLCAGCELDASFAELVASTQRRGTAPTFGLALAALPGAHWSALTPGGPLRRWRLLELGFWVQEPDGDYGVTTRQAVMAFQKYYGLGADGALGPETAAKLNEVTERPQASADAGTLVEVDKSKQLLFFVIDGRTEWILNTSTGTEIPYDEPDKNSPGERQVGDSVTRNGLHDVYRERAEGWWEGDLGQIYRPKYFTGGIAVHGSNSICLGPLTGSRENPSAMVYMASTPRYLPSTTSWPSGGVALSAVEATSNVGQAMAPIASRRSASRSAAQQPTYPSGEQARIIDRKA